VEPTEEYTAARYVRDAVAAIEDIYARDRWPILVGGTGLYYRALVRGLFPGPAADTQMRARLEKIAQRRGVEFLHRMVRRVDPASAQRILPRDLKRLVRCLEVYFLTGTPLTDHFAETVSPLRGYETVSVGLSIPIAEIAERTARRVDQQFERGLLDEIRGLLARGVPETARPFGGLVYRQALEHLHGVRNEVDTRALIAQENRRYARRQLIWFRKEPNLVWLQSSGEQPETPAAVESILAKWPKNFPASS
jgi:tRNA dimethylallyltransferase